MELFEQGDYQGFFKTKTAKPNNDTKLTNLEVSVYTPIVPDN